MKPRKKILRTINLKRHPYLSQTSPFQDSRPTLDEVVKLRRPGPNSPTRNLIRIAARSDVFGCVWSDWQDILSTVWSVWIQELGLAFFMTNHDTNCINFFFISKTRFIQIIKLKTKCHFFKKQKWWPNGATMVKGMTAQHHSDSIKTWSLSLGPTSNNIFIGPAYSQLWHRVNTYLFCSVCQTRVSCWLDINKELSQHQTVSICFN